MLHDLWHALRGKRVEAKPPQGFEAIVPPDDLDEEALVEEAPKAATVLSGFACIIDYRDSSGRVSCRRVTFQRLEDAGPFRYLRAYCHEREAIRQFRLDRITAASDIETGEEIDLVGLLYSLSSDHQQSSRPGWGLCPRDRADLIAGINTMVFVARCDKEWHSLEEEAVESFITSCWLRCGFDAELPLDDLLAYANKLRPDAEAFYSALLRAAERPELKQIIQRNIAAVIDADGKVAPEEFYWGHQVDEFFRAAA